MKKSITKEVWNINNPHTRAFILANYALNKTDSFTIKSISIELLQKYGFYATEEEIKTQLEALVGIGLLIHKYPNNYIVQKERENKTKEQELL